MSVPKPSVWVLVDDKAGHKNQALGVAEALGYPFSKKNIVYDNKASLHNIFKGASLLGIDEVASDNLSPPWPDIVIAAGRRTAPVAKYIKTQNKESFLVQIMWPGFPANGFDLIAVPEHDNLIKRANTITTIGSPHRVTEEILEREGEIWKKTLDTIPHPRIAVLIGGNTEKTSFTTDHAEKLVNLIHTIKGNSSLLITTSRRTPDDVIDVLEQHFGNAEYFHNWSKKRANPYYAFLALSDTVVVTGDSMSMCSEACASGKPVYIFAPENITKEKHKRMLENLYKNGFAIPLDNEHLENVKNDITSSKQKATLNAAKEIAEKIKQAL